MTDPACAELKKYTYAEHRFKFAAWAAGRAAGRGIALKPARKKLGIKKEDPVEFAVASTMLEATGFYELAKYGVKWLPDPEGFDDTHLAWCKEVRNEAEGLDLENADPTKDWMHGRSAKLINVFIKTLMPADLEILPCGEKAKWYAVHPPIDGNVLKGMKSAGIGDQDFWKSLPGSSAYGAFNQFKYGHYQKVIDLIREKLRECGYGDPLPLWKIEWFFFKP